MPNAGKERSRLRAFLDSIRRLFGKKPPQTPEDPCAYQMAPLRHGPKGRSGAVAVAEPVEDSYRSYPPRQ